MSDIERVLQREIPVAVEKWDGYYVASFYVASRHQMAGVTDGATLDELVENIQEVVTLALEGEDPADFGLVEIPSITISYRMELDHPPSLATLEWTGMFYTD